MNTLDKLIKCRRNETELRKELKVFNNKSQRLKRELSRVNDHLQAQIINVGEYVEVMNWLKERPWFNHEEFNRYMESRVYWYVDNSGE